MRYSPIVKRSRSLGLYVEGLGWYLSASGCGRMLCVRFAADYPSCGVTDVLELDKPNDFALGRQLRIGKQPYSDLDNLITAHVRGLARQVDKMVAHDKFKGTEEETVTFMRNFQMAHPERSIYAFAIDRKTAGQFSLMFIPQKGMQPR